jgi:hypothetical protein
MRDRQKDKTAIEAEVRKTLQSLDAIPKMKANPFFYTRLQQRLAARQRRETASRFGVIFHKALRPALVPLLIAVSIGAGIWIGYKPATANRTTSLNSMIETYGLNAPDLSNYTLTVAE